MRRIHHEDPHLLLLPLHFPDDGQQPHTVNTRRPPDWQSCLARENATQFKATEVGPVAYCKLIGLEMNRWNPNIPCSDKTASESEGQLALQNIHRGSRKWMNSTERSIPFSSIDETNTLFTIRSSAPKSKPVGT